MAKLAIDVVLNKAAAMTGLRGLEKDVSSFGKSMLGIVGIGGGLAGIVAGIDGILAKAGQLQDVSDAFNVSAESIQRLGAVGVTANLSIEEIGSKLGKIGKAAQEAAGGNAKLTEAFAKINVKGQELVSLNPEQLFDRLREAVSSGALAGEELKIVNELLAKDYQRFLPLLRMTAEEYRSLGAASGVMSDATVSSLDAMNVKLRQLQNTASTVTAQIFAGFVDLGVDLKESPFANLLDIITGDYDSIEKRIIEREKKLKEAIQKERKQRAGQEKTVQDEQKMEVDKKAFEKSEQEAAKHELRLIEAQVQGKEEAEKMKQAIEERYRQRSLDREIEMANRKAELVPELQDLEAQRAGPQAEMQLLGERATAAADLARKTGNIEDVTNAQKLALELQKAKESEFSRKGFGDQSFARAKAITESMVGALPSAAQFRDIPSSTEAQRTQPVRLENPPNLQGVLDKLDMLIKNAGVFS
jgi:signal transduction histidine kinase